MNLTKLIEALEAEEAEALRQEQELKQSAYLSRPSIKENRATSPDNKQQKSETLPISSPK